MREPEGIETPPPGKSSERPWSKDRESYIRNVEAEGSNPFTSTPLALDPIRWTILWTRCPARWVLSAMLRARSE